MMSSQVPQRVRFVVAGIAAVAALLGLVTAMDSSGVIRLQPPAEPYGILNLRFPTADIPPSVYSIHIHLVGERNRVHTDSVEIARGRRSSSKLRIQLASGRWRIYLRGRDAEGWTRYAGVEGLDVQSNEEHTGTVRLNPLASTTGNREIVVRWGSEPERWRMSLNNPVIATDEGGADRDHYYLSIPRVLARRDEFYLWYVSGFSVYYSGIDSTWTGLAVSRDGERWEKRGFIRFQPSSANIPQKLIMQAVLQDEERLRSWFIGLSDGERYSGTYAAESQDGIQWKFDGAVILPPSPSRPIISELAVTKVQQTYYLYYTVFDRTATPWRREIWLLTSSDGRSWQDKGCVLRGRQDVSWEKLGVGMPAVVYQNGQFHLWYAGVSLDAEERGRFSFGEAASPDGIHWTFVDDAPSMTPESVRPWNVSMIASPSVVASDQGIALWFAGLCQENNRWFIGKAEKVLR